MFSRERIAPFAGMPYGLPGQSHPAQPSPDQPLPLRDLDRRPAPLGVAA